MNHKKKLQQGNVRHQLRFEEAWERTMADSDRLRLVSLFETSLEVEEGDIRFLPYRVAYNHVGELLATVMIQNGSREKVSMRNIALVFEDAKGCMVENTFSYPQLVIEGNSSTPWTFIFPKSVVSTNELDLTSWKIRKRG